jgi:ABC-type multidrug transport system ATPase subunit
MQVIETLVRLARENRTIIASIHQPRSDIVKIFDAVLLLSKGSLVYAGPQSRILEYFDKTLGHPCPHFVNPGRFLFF